MGNVLKFGIPKGSLEEATVNMFRKAGYKIVTSSRSYYPTVDDDELSLLMVRAQEMARYVEEGILDAGITGKDWVMESEAEVEYISELNYSKASKNPVKWIVAVHQDSNIKTLKDLEGKRVATEAVGLTRKHFEKRGVKAQIEFSWGATEVKCPKLADAIVDITETGSSLRANNLVIIDEVMISTTQLIANKEALKDGWKKNKIENIDMALQAVLEADNKVGLMLNVEKKNLDPIINVLPALQKPTISNLSDDGWIAVNTIIEEKVVRDLIPILKKNGASGIVEYPLNKIIL
ncbi:MAG TPA: ATP phosphoribosyltransferase [Spirochaetota bacterium]|nr:ATP phosphoribosyltransferase [Spirochaetota bacterium]HOS32310.1 ATP phosphoribosyltransferase [Spirochaetota bacterium]HOS54676.1 ATP phosphoribosyltransferase [Spirochaetota bacterium]HPK60976.1 ATP phosphoribosyltransferase [Spirochaetota bacterium]HQF77304.1 ATP phosphoribosyltransferase [Spirochaetota bacterium]